MANQEKIRTFLESNLRTICENRFLWANAAFHELLDHDHDVDEVANAYIRMTEERRALQTVYEDMRLWHPSNGTIKVETVLEWREGKRTRIP